MFLRNISGHKQNFAAVWSWFGTPAQGLYLQTTRTERDSHRNGPVHRLAESVHKQLGRAKPGVLSGLPVTDCSYRRREQEPALIKSSPKHLSRQYILDNRYGRTPGAAQHQYSRSTRASWTLRGLYRSVGGITAMTPTGVCGASSASRGKRCREEQDKERLLLGFQNVVFASWSIIRKR